MKKGVRYGCSPEAREKGGAVARGGRQGERIDGAATGEAFGGDEGRGGEDLVVGCWRKFRQLPEVRRLKMKEEKGEGMMARMRGLDSRINGSGRGLIGSSGWVIG
ncbi:hypothetical protein HAX54_018803 [Datura stramonium]|uniref:Uncharacterized protein n=1 Tax=Datura stramonium TaxID=4076 RepID=A0ABS8UN42_DATST|nr:hypothetical protein [Datura stramonium]